MDEQALVRLATSFLLAVESRNPKVAFWLGVAGVAGKDEALKLRAELDLLAGAAVHANAMKNREN
jgi:hypothetical protein